VRLKLNVIFKLQRGYPEDYVQKQSRDRRHPYY